MSDGQVCALVGTVGGAGTTRLALEFAATLGRDGRSAVVVDAGYATQGLATAVPGRVDADLTAAVTEDRPLSGAVHGLDLPVAGRVAAAPARAPFERLSRAKTSECARRLAERLATAARTFDHVVVDVPPVATNPSVAAVTAADCVVLVTPDSQRGADALPRSRDRLADVDAAVDAVVVNRAGDRRVEDADARVPTAGTTALPEAPTVVDDAGFATAVADAVETVFTVDLDPGDDSSSLTDYFPG
jgi:cellulose biosynthesis protein BcsQ